MRYVFQYQALYLDIMISYLGKNSTLFLQHKSNKDSELTISLNRGYDLSIKSNFNGKERDSDDWIKLFSGVSPDFRVLRMHTPPGAMLSIIEVIWDGPTSFVQ